MRIKIKREKRFSWWHRRRSFGGGCCSSSSVVQPRTRKTDEKLKTIDEPLQTMEIEIADDPNASSKMSDDAGTNITNKDQPTTLVALPTPTIDDEEDLLMPDLEFSLWGFAYGDLESATAKFGCRSLLGEGRFGSVHKGWIKNIGFVRRKCGTNLPIAVKKLYHNGQMGDKGWLISNEEWLAEINLLGELQHPNLVRLIGYCIENDERLLVCEFIPKSLENHLFKGYRPFLSWSARMKIALDAARGLAFLHDNAKSPVICRDFKTSNILLDDDFNAKLSDFGLFKDYIGKEGDVPISSRTTGTYGYCAPECVMTGVHTSKSDVFGFGVVLLELLTGRRSIDRSLPGNKYNLLAWAQPYLADSRIFCDLMDPQLQGQFRTKDAQDAVKLAALCLREDQTARPLMSEVVTILELLLSLITSEG